MPDLVGRAAATPVPARDGAAGADALAREALRLALSDPAAATALADRALAALGDHDHAADDHDADDHDADDRVRDGHGTRRRHGVASRAHRAAGVAALQLRRLEEAERRLRAAVAEARAADDAALAGEARMSLASTLMLRGRPDEASAAIGAALADLGPVDPVAAARARTQRAALAQELGHLDEALADLRLALPVLRRAGDAQWEAQALSNRSLMLTARRQFAAAEADLVRARALCLEAGLLLQSGYIEQNLGCVRADRGDVPAALAHFDRAAARYRELGVEVGSLSVDRARALLAVRLVGEGRAAAEQAVAVFTRQGRALNVPEAQLLTSAAALLGDDPDGAAAAARAAVEAFSRLDRTEWRALAVVALLQAGYRRTARATAEPRGEAPDQAARASLLDRLTEGAAEAERVGWLVPAQELRLLAARLALDLGRVEIAEVALARTARVRRGMPADVRARAWLGEALLRRSQGSRLGARAALRAGLRVLEEFGATLGASELRAHASVHRGALARLGVAMALEDRDARGVHTWSEHGRTRALELRPARPPADPELATELQDLRTTVAELDQARSAGAPTARLLARQVELEHAIRDRTRRLAPGDGLRWRRPPGVAELAAALGETALVEYVESDGVLHAVTVTDGVARLRTLGSTETLHDTMRHLPFALHRMADPATPERQLTAAAPVVDRAARVLDALLLAPLDRLLGDRPLVLVPTGWLQSVPWALLARSRGRPVAVTPSTALWQAAVERTPAPGPVTVVAGPQLPGAVREAAQVAALHPGAWLLTGAAAVAGRVAPALDGASLAHLAAHGLVRADNPQFSAVLLADGPYTVHDLDALTATPHHVVLAACNTALAHTTAGPEILGLSAALLTRQTATLVAPVVPVTDAETVGLMTGYHRRLRAGASPAAALAAEQQARLDDGPQARATAAGFVCLGAGHRPG
ncbi:CHAT domain-containing protein/tetratricopeptide (TPR) repeat protein [Friedmanniella endophytica]|uniref:CHAT domain-containing protein/tetratricopeptide (TPR) repeat protein n=1 Tax=Microlunatus kandeliicorticis TaxID=1759536 RepID=A0A7W3P745_9ACTN|nr:CHAT domain-containing protein [Microlunatus kandeliicorticis]MBA8795721.1 CHAT domain-containing protein/tetratricopeptide (TPR) repeat protein [Microlunatus kandeliicorticis]